MNKTLLVVFVSAIVALGVVFVLAPDINVNIPEYPNVGANAGTEHYFEETFYEGVNFESSLTVGSSGTAISQYRCDTATWDPGALSTSSAPSQDISNTGAALGDPCIADFNSATSTGEWDAVCKVTGSATSTIYLNQLGDAATDITTSTAKVCTFQ